MSLYQTAAGAAAMGLCGNILSPTPEQLAGAAAIDALDFDLAPKLDVNGDIQMVPIDIYFHAANMANETNGPYGFGFRLAGMDIEINDTTSNLTLIDNQPPILMDGIDITGSTPAVEEWWKRKRQGEYDALNVYIYYSIGGYAGMSAFPNPNRTAERDWWLDGVHIYGGTMEGVPGGAVDTDNGGVLIHEVGHWLSLYHTFQDTWTAEECNGLNDRVADTPASMSSAPGECTGSENTCPDVPGNDPVFNYMNYSGDKCWNHLTGGQVVRAHRQFSTIRRPSDR